MCRRRISVAGEAEEIAVSPGSRSSRQKHGKRQNPYSTRGLDKFESVCAELSAKRAYIAKKVGTSEAIVRFVDSKNGWTPVVVRAREAIGKKKSGVGAAGASILGPVVKNNGKEDRELSRNVGGNDMNGGSESVSISVFHERNHSLVRTWSRFLKTKALGGFGYRAIWVRKSAAAMATITAFGISYYAVLFRNPKNANPNHIGRSRDEEIAEQKDVDKPNRRTLRPGLTVKPKDMNDKHKNHHQFISKAEKVRMVAAIDNWPDTRTARMVAAIANRPDTRTARPARRFHSFHGRTSPAMGYDARVGAILMIITLFCFVFYGWLGAILLWLYLLPMFNEFQKGMNRKKRMVNLQS